ncbi:ubiquinone biosynthesis accessory factor UbiJ [Dechloromonas sp. A34]|uniref:ubiquinone biosynthesis accessory factor UbiJ n=1 Tax=Dechloromonas sp. A34 TaxID=447588 RepID=UPI002248CEDC|nr:hypothetical protein [Dechloromonas sp. A34]
MLGVDKLLVSALNHLLQAESWARERLRPHAGAQVSIAGGPLQLNLRIDAQGLLAAGSSSGIPDVSVTLAADTPARFLIDRNSLFSSVKIAGAVDIAESLAFVFRHLRWDAEADLANLVGDIPARRLALFAARVGSQAQESARRLIDNMAEYAIEDSTLLAAKRDVVSFGKAVDQLREDLAHLEKRIARL